MRNAELTVKEFLIAILRRLRMILLLALIGAVLSGALRAYTTTLGISAQQDDYAIQLAAWQQALSSKRASIKDSQTIAAQAREYNSNSLLMRVDPYKKQVASLSFSISVSPDAVSAVGLPQGQTLSITDMQRAAVQAITARYLLLASGAELNEALAGVYAGSAPNDYLRELIQVEEFSIFIGAQNGYLRERIQVEEFSSYPNDVNLPEDTGIITITVTGTEGLDAKTAADAMFNYLKQQKPLVEQSSVAHGIMVMEENAHTISDSALADYQNKQRALLADNAARVIQLQQEISDLQDQRPQAPSLAYSVVQGAMLGFLLGLVLGIGLSILLYLVRLPVHYATQIERQLGLRFLGGEMPAGKGLINRLAAESLLSPSAQATALMAANIAQAAGGAKRILITGTLSASDITALAQRLGEHEPQDAITFIPAEDITRDAQSVRELDAADAIILAERLYTSRLRQILGVRNRAQASGKPLLGYILT